MSLRYNDLIDWCRPLAGAALAVAAAASLGPAPADAASTTIVISEVEADPTPIGSDLSGEWFELMNISGQAISLNGWTITDDQSTDVIPSLTLDPGGCVVIAADTTTFRAAHPAYGGALVRLGSIGSGLTTLGDCLFLRDDAGADVDCVSWGSNTTCLNPAAAVPQANTVATLQRVSPSPDTDTSADWTSTADESPCPSTVGVFDPPGPRLRPALRITPNPAFGSTSIACSGVADGPLAVSVHDAAGRRLRTLRDAGTGPTRTFVWDGRDERGRAAPGGVYLVRVASSAGLLTSGRVLLLR